MDVVNEKCRKIFEGLPDGVLLFDARLGKVLFANARMCALLRYDESALFGTPLWDLLPSNIDLELRTMSATNQADRVHDFFDVELQPRSGARLICDMRVSTYWLEDASVQIAVVNDATVRRQAEDRLRAKIDELDRYFESSLDLLCIADTEGYFKRLNREWQRTLGYTVEELTGRQFLELVHPDDVAATLDAVSTLAAQEEVRNFVNRYRHKDSSWRWIEWRSFPLGSQIYAVARDITDRILSEETLKECERMLRQSQRVARRGHICSMPPPVECRYDAHQIQQMLCNILTNAVEVTDGGGHAKLIVDNIGIDKDPPSGMSRGTYVRVRIEDKGVGIPTAHLPRIFDPFFSTKASGNGLGLSTSWSIVTRHGGHIDVQTAEGKGTSVTVYLRKGTSR